MLRVLVFVMIASAGLACDEKKKGKSGLASLALGNATGLSLQETGPNAFTPISYGIKLVSVRLMQEASGMSGIGPIIWVSPDCPSKATATEVDGYSYDYVGMEGCARDAVQDYFEFARDTEEVNADLNSQQLKVVPGSYKYVTLGWCEGELQDDFLSFQTEDMDEPFVGTNSGGCLGATSVEAVPPIVIGPGESVVISLEYDLTGIVIDRDYLDNSSASMSCWEGEIDGEVTKRCASLPNFIPSFSKVDAISQ